MTTEQNNENGTFVVRSKRIGDVDWTIHYSGRDRAAAERAYMEATR